MALYGIYGSHTVEACPVNNLEVAKAFVAFAESRVRARDRFEKRDKRKPGGHHAHRAFLVGFISELRTKKRRLRCAVNYSCF